MYSSKVENNLFNILNEDIDKILNKNVKCITTMGYTCPISFLCVFKVELAY